MQNIAMCQYAECPKSQECLRFMDKPAENQCYLLFQNICKDSNNFKWYYKIPIQDIVVKEN
jgi:hypothetical protein